MLPAPHRLRTPEQFRVVLRGRCGESRLPAARAGGDLMVVHAVARPERADEPTRVGLVVSKAVGNAVVRNRVARRLRHQSAELMRPQLHAPTALPSAGWDVVVRALPAAGQADSSALGHELSRLTQRVASRLDSRLVATSGAQR